ncbi:DHH family phosphoesterase [Coraliomargarita parva]|uniref:DHH family phosphoesterase n=1 Tax=Coraliomargarita parva TaxID=3014050 RepID=UPI0022B4AE7F|nr:bifunctional oligoribonuclease/PAP phosphatase NrnA [Coraliomargarita parva]
MIAESKFFAEDSARFAAALEQLKGHKVAVLGHVRPDGDCIGSIVAMVRLLRSQGIEAIGVNRDPVPMNLCDFVADTPLVRSEDFELDGHIAVTVDSADFKRVGDRLNELFPEVALNVDHHISNKAYAAENLIIDHASATAEILAGFFLDLGLPIDPVMAQALYVGIATDTGQFRFPSTTPETFEITRQLCEHGARPAAAAHELYERESFAKIKLLQAFLASLRMEVEDRVCVGLLEDGVYDETGATVEDSEGLVDYARSIEGVDVGVLLEQRGRSLKGSLRAKDPFFRVDQVAKLFHGGGHACAAGLNVEDSSIEEFLPQLIEAIRAHLAELGQPA